MFVLMLLHMYMKERGQRKVFIKFFFFLIQAILFFDCYRSNYRHVSSNYLLAIFRCPLCLALWNILCYLLCYLWCLWYLFLFVSEYIVSLPGPGIWTHNHLTRTALDWPGWYGVLLLAQHLSICVKQLNHLSTSEYVCSCRIYMTAQRKFHFLVEQSTDWPKMESWKTLSPGN